MSSSYLFLLVLLLMCAVAGVAWRLSARRLRRAYEVRLQQLAERERVATSLHDALLQSLQGMILRFQGVGHRLAADSPERAALENILDQADEVLAEGRHQILALRVPVVDGDDLSQALAALGQSMQDSFHTPFRMRVSGGKEPVRSDCREEIYCVARVALFYAFQQAGEVELELVYGNDSFALYVRTDADEQAWPSQGLSALNESAARLGASIDVISLPGQGTAVRLKLAAQLCYQTPRRPRWRRRMAAWLDRAAP